MKFDTLINVAEASRVLTGNNRYINKTRCAAKYRPAMDELNVFMRRWRKKHDRETAAQEDISIPVEFSIDLSERHCQVFNFQPAAESVNLKDETRALVVDKDGFYQIGIWFENGGWYDEGSICYSGGIGGEIPDVVEFALLDVE
jgi:hypothetical protein